MGREGGSAGCQTLFKKLSPEGRERVREGGTWAIAVRRGSYEFPLSSEFEPFFLRKKEIFRPELLFA